MPRTFTLLRTLGRGAHGTVHLAELRDDDDWRQTVAVKRLLPEWSRDPDLVARLKDEARLLALLQHEHVVRVHGLTRIDGDLAILMEAVDGADLGRLSTQHGALPPRVAVEIVLAVADALDAAWEATPAGQAGPLRVVHRDIKPSNVMLTARGGVKVMDFGVARADFDSREVETRSQQYGTARYMAPERWLSGRTDHASDVFSLGVTFAEIASGAPVARPRLVPALFDEDVRAAAAGLPDALVPLALEMTRFDPDARPTGREVAERCRALLPSLPGPSLREWSATAVVPAAPQLDASATSTVVVESPLVTTEGAAVAPVVAPSRRWWAPWVGAAAAAAIATYGIRELRGPDAVPLPRLARPPAPVLVVARPPEPEVEPERPPEAAVVAPAPRDVERPTPVGPEVVPAPPPAPETVFVPVRFVVARGLTAETEFGSVVRSPVVLSVPTHRTVLVTVTEGDTTWTCTIHVAGSAVEVRIHPQAEGRCSQS